MRITRVRKFRKSTEMTIVLEGNDARALCHAIDSSCIIRCIYPERRAYGLSLLHKLLAKFQENWLEWED